MNAEFRISKCRIENAECRVMDATPKPQPTLHSALCTPNSPGFTLIELMVVMGILAIISTIGLVFTLDFYRSYAFNSEQSVVVSILQKARSQSLANINQQPHGVHFGPNGYTIFQGSTYTPNAATNQELDASPGVTNNLPPDIIFSQLSGNSSYSGQILLSYGTRSSTITLNSVGQINW